MAYFYVIFTLWAAATISGGWATGDLLTATKEKRNINKETKYNLEYLPVSIDQGGNNFVQKNNNNTFEPKINAVNRGKRDYEYSDIGDRKDDDKRFLINGPNRLFLGMNPKRAPSGFMGMRGKRLFYDEIDGVGAGGGGGQEKRVPSGFFGMRGKKDLRNYGSSYPLNADGLGRQISIAGADDRETALLPFYSAYYQNAEIWPNEIDDFVKRAPSSGFVGMRGKRMSNDDSWKRAPTGFLGMRGKRLYGSALFEQTKRIPSNGFMGMRGKRENYNQDDVDDEDNDDPASRNSVLEKRFISYFGMRGKKQPALNSGFFGMRGKKEPSFRNKFVGVRGKKIPTLSEGSLRQLENELNDGNYKEELQQQQQDSSSNDYFLQHRLDGKYHLVDNDEEFESPWSGSDALKRAGRG